MHARWDALDAFVEQAVALDPAAQFAFFGGQLLLYRALVEARRGDLDAALKTFTDGRARYRAVGGGTGLPTCQALLAEQFASGGRLADAAELVAGARQQIADTGDLGGGGNHQRADGGRHEPYVTLAGYEHADLDAPSGGTAAT